ncbi:hypothetical protein SAMN05216302_104321 [Nitrosomonas aestuarii]|uniref:NUDIX domain-containing protein n=1 Tax=Nitrosomonas aestuarii TaxID=52441 RepID=A0A1I4FWC6_9PROT|nr:hypothetical protein [Nitrosomonas aestuarii]SFL21779.1 hypothetical protein SAMN05216302_104321 [Nitrosomonas aestuarii]
MCNNLTILNEYLFEIGHVLGEWNHAPAIYSVGKFLPTPSQQAICKKVKAELAYSERQAIAAPSAELSPGKTIPFLETEFAMIHGRRLLGETVPSLTVGTLLCCPERSELYVQRRSLTTATYPGRFSMFGGHFCLDQEKLGYGEIIDCLVREVKEEAQIDLPSVIKGFPDSLPVSVMIEEKATGSLQYTPLCLAIPEDSIGFIVGGHEGDIVTLHLEKDAELIMQKDQWSPMGFSTIVSWVYRDLPVQSNWTGSIFSKQLIENLKSYQVEK